MTQKYIKKYRVNFTEYERGWGQRPAGFEDFDTLAEATSRMTSYNSQNNQTNAPDWFIKAEQPKETYIESN